MDGIFNIISQQKCFCSRAEALAHLKYFSFLSYSKLFLQAFTFGEYQVIEM